MLHSKNSSVFTLPQVFSRSESLLLFLRSQSFPRSTEVVVFGSALLGRWKILLSPYVVVAFCTLRPPLINLYQEKPDRCAKTALPPKMTSYGSVFTLITLLRYHLTIDWYRSAPKRIESARKNSTPAADDQLRLCLDFITLLQYHPITNRFRRLKDW